MACSCGGKGSCPKCKMTAKMSAMKGKGKFKKY